MLLAALLVLAGIAATVPQFASAAVTCPNANAVVNENNCMGAGSSGWQVQNYSADLGGFPTVTSVNVGQSVPLKIGTDLASAQTINLTVYRIGWYGGAGGRLVYTQNGVAVNNSFTCNPMDATTGELSCSNWNVTTTIPSSALPVSGIYEAVLTDKAQPSIQNSIEFTVRDDSRASKMLVVMPMATYYAYNTWGCKSLYFDKCGGANTVSGSDRAVAVSFDRPLDIDQAGWHNEDLELVQWLEQQGYDASYTDDVQTDIDGSTLLHHKIDIVSGHSEYWSYASFNNLLAARDAGVSIASFSGNTAYWQTRYADNHRTLICYKTVQGPGTPNDPASLGPDGVAGTADDLPQFATTTRRDPGAPAGTPGAPPGGRIGINQPENTLFGNMYVGDNDTHGYALHIPAGDTNGQYAANRIWRNTGISSTAGGTISTNGGWDVVGWEWDQIPNAASPLYSTFAAKEPLGVKQLSLTDVTDNVNDSYIQDAGNVRATTPPPGQPSNASAVEYRMPSGSVVFAAGTILWFNGVDIDGDFRLAQTTYNLFSDMGVQPGTPTNIVVDPGTYKPPPWATFTISPSPVHYGSTVTFNASSSFVTSGATLRDYQWDFTGNGTWTDVGASATTTHVYPTQGTYTVRMKVTDSNGNTDIESGALTVTGDPPPKASVTATPAKPVTNQTVTLDASGSTGPVNPIVDYKWDLTGSGTYSVDTGSSPTTTTSFASTGTHTVGLQVTDSKGQTGTTQIGVTVLSTGASRYPDAIQVTPGLLHYYRLGESSGPVINDSAGNANGNIAGGTFGAPGAIQGDPNTAISFNGLTDFGQIPMNLSGQRTISLDFWLKWNTYANDDRLAMELTPNFNDNSGGFIVDPDASDGTFSVALGQGSSRNIAAFARPSAGDWHYYAFVLDTTASGATTITPYVDGQPVTYTKQGQSGTGAGNFANSTLYLMSRGGSSLFGVGTLDELGIYSGALDPQRIADHYNSFGTNPRPVAALKISPNPAPLNRTVTFDASGSTYKNGSITKYEWDLTGSGKYTQTTTTPTITTTYATEQTAKVGLRVTDSDQGTDYTTASFFVGNSPPVASLKASPNPAIAGQVVKFDATGSFVPNDTISDAKWDLDGSGTYATDTGTTLTLTHAFSKPGTYNVGLKLTSSAGKVTTTTIKVAVTDVGLGDYEDSVLGTPGLLHYYKLGETAGPTINDSAGHANGSITGGSFGASGPVAGDPTSAISFNGSSDAGQVSMDLSGSKIITVEFWLKWNSYSNNDALAMEFTPNFNDNAGGFLVDPNSSFGQFAVSIGTGGSRNIAFFQRPSANVWHYYAFVLDTTQPGATTITPYVDGQPQSFTQQGYAGTGAGNFANSTLYLMSRGASGLFGAGTLGQLAIYNGGLTANQIVDHYNSNGTNKPPTASFTASPARAAAGQNVTFDASASKDPDGQIVDYQWDLDGSGKFATDTGSSPTLSTTFATPGTYNVSVRVIDDGNASNAVTHAFVVGDDPPNAAFSVSPSPLALVGQQVSFDGSGSTDGFGTITDYKWDLDGSGQFTTDTGSTPRTAFTYTTPGTYMVSLQVTNGQGQKSIVTHAVAVHAATYKNTVLGTPGLVSYWGLGDPVGSTTLADSAGTNAATNFGGVLGTSGAIFGDPTTAASFDGRV